MAQQINFITSDYLRQNSVIDKNVDTSILNICIRTAQEINIEKVLGTDLYDKLVADNLSYTGYYLILMEEYVKRCLVQWSIFHALPYIATRITNVGTVKKTSDNSNAASEEDIISLKDTVASTAREYSQRITNYLKANCQYFPEYHSNDTDGGISPSNDNYSLGIWLPD